ncbi:MAG: CAP domain-containing protein, partial [Chloroflexota bacterium]
MKSLYNCIFVALLFLTFILMPSEKVDAQPVVLSPDRTAQEMIVKVNTLRNSNGLLPYSTNPILMKVAQSHADYIASTGVLTHFDQDGKRPYQRAIDAGYDVAGNLSSGGLLTEAIFSGSGISDDEVISTWQSNAADSVALLSSSYEDVGVGISASNGITYYVLVAGSENELTSPLASPVVGTSISVGTSAPVATVGTGTVYPNTALPDGEIYHVVRKNEALWSVAILYSTTIEELKLLNGLATDEIFEGQKILVRAVNTQTPTPSPIPVTVTLGIPTSTVTLPVTPTKTSTPTPVPTPPTSLQNGGMVVGGITFVALLAAGLGAFLGRAKKKNDDNL